MKTILFVTSEYPPGPGGIGNQAYNIVEQLKEHGFKMLVVTEQRSFKYIGKDSSVKYIRRGFLPFYFSYFFHIIFYAVRFKPDVLFFSGSKSLVSGFLGNLFFLGKKMAIYHGHEWHMSGALGKLFIKLFIDRAHSVVAVSEFSKKRIQEFSNQIVNVIPNGINLSEVHVGPRSAYVPSSKRLKLLTVGAVSERKGQMNVINALPSIAKVYPEVQYHMVGVPLCEKQVLKQAEHLDVEHLVHIHGVVDDEKLVEIYVDSDIFLMLSNNLPNGDVEGFGIAIIEANAYGIPSIGSFGTGIEDAIDNGLSGVLVNADRPAEIVLAINNILENFAMYSERSQRHASKHQWSLLIDKYLDLMN